MDRYEAMVALAGIIFGMAGTVGVVWGIAWGVVKSKKVQGALPDGALLRLEQRIERIEHAIDAVAVEVERISEGQRFTTKLLSDQSGERLGG